VPGKKVAVTFIAGKAGKFTFVCDNFCGEDHGRMMGFLIVTETALKTEHQAGFVAFDFALTPFPPPYRLQLQHRSDAKLTRSTK